MKILHPPLTLHGTRGPVSPCSSNGAPILSLWSLLLLLLSLSASTSPATTGVPPMTALGWRLPSWGRGHVSSR